MRRNHIRTLVLHSGTFKTGSTSIQLFLSQNAPFLRAAGCAYPDVGRHDPGVQHVNLVAELKGWKAFAPERGGWDELFASMRSTDTPATIVSSESFSSLSPGELEEVGQKCRVNGVRLVWIHYLREQSDFLNAFYVERLMTLRPEFSELVTRPFEEFLEWSPVDLDFLDYAKFAERVVSAIPDVDLRLRPFVRSELAGGDVIQDFVATVGVDLDVSGSQSTNVGVGWRTTELAKRVTPLLGHAAIGDRVMHAPNPTAARLRSIALIRRSLLEATTTAGWNNKSAVYCTAEYRRELRERFRAANLAVTRHCDFDFAEIVERAPDKPFNVGDVDEIPASEVLDVMSQVLPSIIDPPLPENLTPKS